MLVAAYPEIPGLESTEKQPMRKKKEKKIRLIAEKNGELPEMQGGTFGFCKGRALRHVHCAGA
jgi:hypothetical protein